MSELRAGMYVMVRGPSPAYPERMGRVVRHTANLRGEPLVHVRFVGHPSDRAVSPAQLMPHGQADEMNDLAGVETASSGLDWRGLDLTSYDPPRRRLFGLDARNARLDHALLDRTNLRRADLRSASLRSANLREADLREADLRGADLSGADLSGAKLAGANLAGAMTITTNFYDAVGVWHGESRRSATVAIHRQVKAAIAAERAKGLNPNETLGTVMDITRFSETALTQRAPHICHLFGIGGAYARRLVAAVEGMPFHGLSWGYYTDPNVSRLPRSES